MIIIRITIVAALVAFSMSAFSGQQVQFAGFAFLGDFEHVRVNYPHSVSLNEVLASNQPQLEQALADRLNNSALQNIDIQQAGLANLEEGESISLAFTLHRELVSIEKISENYKLIVELAAQALFFDFNEMTIIGSFPFTVQYIDVLKEPPSDNYIRSTVKSLYIDESEVNVFGKFVEVISTLDIKPKYHNRLQVSLVNIEDKAFPYLPEKYRENEENLKNFLAQSFGQFLSANQGVSVLPYTKGYAIGNKMSAQFSNGDVFNLTIPEADYEIEISLRGFKKVEFDKTSIGSSWVYGAYTHVRVYEPLSGRNYLDTNLKNGATKLIPLSQELVDDWPAFQESLLALFNSFTRELDSPSKKWAKTHAGDKAVISQLKAFKKVVNQCI